MASFPPLEVHSCLKIESYRILIECWKRIVILYQDVEGGGAYILFIVGASLCEPHTSVTALAEVVCMLTAIYRKF